MDGVPRSKRRLPPELVAIDHRIETWRSSLLSQLPSRVDVARFLLTSVVSHQIGHIFEQCAPTPSRMGAVEQFARQRLFGLYFALDGLRAPLPPERFVTELVASALSAEQGQQAVTIIDQMVEYASARDVFLTYQWGGYELEEARTDYLRFVDPPIWMGLRDRAEQLLSQEIKGERAISSLSGTRSALVRPLRFLAEEVDLPPTLPLGGITVEEFAHAWLGLLGVLMTRPNGLGQVLNRKALVGAVATSAEIGLQAAQRFVDLASYEGSQHRSLTLFHTPLVPITASELLTGWGLMFGNPGTCMLRLAIHRGSGVNAVTRAIEEHLLDMLRTRFERGPVAVRTNVPYSNQTDHGDLDLVAYDRDRHRVMLCMLKAFITPDTVDEVVRANQSLDDALKQIERARQWWERGGGAAFPALFGESCTRGVPEVDWIVMGNGFAGSDYLQVADGVHVTDAQFLLRPTLGSTSIFDAVAMHETRLRAEMRKAQTSHERQTLQVAGVRIDVPCWGLIP